MTTITVIGRRWFQKTCGNTYHTATVLIDGQADFPSPKQYGYGAQYEQTALDWIDADGVLEPREKGSNGSFEAAWRWAQRCGYTYEAHATDVARSKDLSP